jgi:hypothetical protein
MNFIFRNKKYLMINGHGNPASQQIFHPQKTTLIGKQTCRHQNHGNYPKNTTLYFFHQSALPEAT